MRSKKSSSIQIKDSAVEELVEIRKEVSKNKKWGFDLPEKEFIKGMVFLNPQSYGSRIETYIKEQLVFTKVKAKDNHGDLMNSIANLFYEVKISLLTSINESLNLVQIRLWQNNDYYICVAYDFRDINNYRKYLFLLTHDEMVEETKSATAAHGTKKSNKNNENVELRFSFKCNDDDETFVHWKENYLIENYEEII